MRPSPTLVPRLTPVFRHTPSPSPAILYPTYTSSLASYTPLSSGDTGTGTSKNYRYEYDYSKTIGRITHGSALRRLDGQINNPQGQGEKKYKVKDNRDIHRDVVGGWGDWWVGGRSPVSLKSSDGQAQARVSFKKTETETETETGIMSELNPRMSMDDAVPMSESSQSQSRNRQRYKNQSTTATSFSSPSSPSNSTIPKESSNSAKLRTQDNVPDQVAGASQAGDHVPPPPPTIAWNDHLSMV
ncbi:hypothetical protein IAT40_007483 [Kwoniella sp. CBS 6097]